MQVASAQTTDDDLYRFLDVLKTTELHLCQQRGDNYIITRAV